MLSTLRVYCGQLFSIGFSGYEPSAALLARISAGEVGGVTLFGDNIQSPTQVSSLVQTLRQAAPARSPLLISIDQEGGAVQRLRSPLTVWPPMLAVGAAGDVQRTEAVGRALGKELAALGIGWNLAPVLDTHTNPANPVIGSRAFGTTAEDVTSHGLAFWNGLSASGLSGCGKHFPGHGDTQTDSHYELPVVLHDQTRLEQIEMAPFCAAIKSGREALMTAHVLYPSLDAANPATLSARIISQLLRGALGFEGLVVSDDLGMKAIAERDEPHVLVIRSLLAGVDHFLLRGPHAAQEKAFEGLLYAAERDQAIAARVNESAERFLHFKARNGVGAPMSDALLASVLGSPAHRALADSFPQAWLPTVDSPVVSA